MRKGSKRRRVVKARPKLQRDGEYASPQYKGFLKAVEKRNEDQMTREANALFRAAQHLTGSSELAFGLLIGAAIMAGEDHIEHAYWNAPTEAIAGAVGNMSGLADSVGNSLRETLTARHERRVQQKAAMKKDADDFLP